MLLGDDTMCGVEQIGEFIWVAVYPDGKARRFYGYFADAAEALAWATINMQPEEQSC